MSVHTSVAVSAATPERIDLLARVPLFSAFTPQELADLAPRFAQETHAKGEVLFEEGDEAGDFFVVADGELEVIGGGATKRVVNRLRQGDHLGEMALLLGGRRTATVRVSHAARLLTMDAAEFHEHLESNPKVLAVIARNLSRDLDARTREEVAARKTLTIGVSGEPGLKGKTLISHVIATLLARQTRQAVLVIDVERVGKGRRASRVKFDAGSAQLPFEPGAETTRLSLPDPAANGGWSARALTALVERVQFEFPVIVLDLGARGRMPPRVLGEACDVIVALVADADETRGSDYGESSHVLPVVNLHNRQSRPFPLSRCEPFLLRDDPSLRGLHASAQVAYVCDHPRSPISPGLHRLVRKLRGGTVGVALAGGAAFGLGHIGVLRVLEDSGVPVDVIAGTSMGSIVGALYATGLTAREMAELTMREATIRKALSAIDFTVARPGLLAGSRLTQILRDLGLTGTFEDLAIPYQAAAADIESGERVAIGSGELAAACRASASLPAIFAPIRRDGHILVDGGVVDQVPTGLVRDMGADVVIAVTVIPTLHKGVKTVFTRLSNNVNAINPLSYLAGARGMPTIIDVLMNSLQLLQYQLGTFEAMSADAQIEVDTSDFTWVDFHQAPALIERGVRAAEAALPAVQRLLAERPALAG